jgi:acetoin utilization protein AcuB
MKSRKIRRLLVLDGARLVGIVTLTDLQKLLFENPGQVPFERVSGLKVSEIMTPGPLTVGPDDAIEKAALLMYENKISALPVVKDARLVGIITETDLFKAVVRIMGAHAQGTRITFDLDEGFGGLPLVLELSAQFDIRILAVVTLHPHAEDKTLVVMRASGAGVQDFIEELRRSRIVVLSIA